MNNKEFKSDVKNRYRGIHWVKSKRWQVFIKKHGKKIYIGTFLKLLDAIDAYDKKAIELFGDKAIINKNLIEKGILNIPTEKFDFIPNLENNSFNNSFENEIWKNVPGYEGFYMASNKGRVHSLNRRIPTKRESHPFLIVSGKILSPKIDKDGYLHVVLCKNSFHKHMRVHKIIALTFIENPNNYLEINHKNNIRCDNRVENLEWATNRMNQFQKWKTFPKKQIKYKTNRKISLQSSVGHASKLTVEKVREMKNLYISGNYTQEELGKKYNVSTSHVSGILANRNWKLITI